MDSLELQPGESKLATVADLLSCNFFIPPFQRPYDWDEAQVKELVQDLTDSERKKTPLFLGLVVVCPDDRDGWAIIDGQQRLTTLMLALAARGNEGKVLRPDRAGISTPWISPRMADLQFAAALLRGKPTEPTVRSQRLLGEAYELLRQSEVHFADETVIAAQVIVYVSPSLAGATRLFERINLRGKRVSQFDLVKNKLIEWAASAGDGHAQRALEKLITRRVQPRRPGNPKLAPRRWPQRVNPSQDARLPDSTESRTCLATSAGSRKTRFVHRVRRTQR
jgi:hypothetical protein